MVPPALRKRVSSPVPRPDSPPYKQCGLGTLWGEMLGCHWPFTCARAYMHKLACPRRSRKHTGLMQRLAAAWQHGPLQHQLPSESSWKAHPYRMEVGRLGARPGKPPESPEQPSPPPSSSKVQLKQFLPPRRRHLSSHTRAKVVYQEVHTLSAGQTQACTP